MKKTIILFIIICAALLITASFFDLQIDTFLYNPESAFGHFFAKAGMLPPSVLLPFTSGFLLGSVFILRKKIKKLCFIASLLLSIAGIASAGIAVKSYYEDIGDSFLPAPLAALAVITAVIFIIGTILGKKLSQKYPLKALNIALIGVVSLIASNFAVHVLKNIWGRQRFFSMTDPALQFTQWYLPQKPAVSDEFKSFPSGHSVNAMSLIWLSLFASFIKKKAEFWGRIIACAAVVFTFAVMLSRMVLGMHFLSDVTMGASIFLIAFFLSKYLADKYCSLIFLEKIA